ncbi:type IV toxin-antitoxin system YeeU family antitoxin [Salmonella enterica]|uniref:Type IV toxin-antitoxin system YeeU family antitoxin n=1 Tax=Salmonella diarizonae TaxID=59204 RepID=A0A5Y1YDR6_SALDZ|nr:type IV toxin-antitoxin system YeeU family antitoxin [Salmonella enterica]EBX5402070.1 type IV toxin-antitoxin system YeeU family antitoxin [Salmonella enterica subsp. enterica serovar Java]ECC3917364.1 type IV toxin-antitoxin system YeeU family antitoxin [Salmonella enterica subsp. diarizonae]EBE1092626.1 type IV toxin-antitoxin system YeeU family antitoxin [Salmonella enterica]ECO8337975.1 type IV toxin-antitoxin system YeeU family antitoxin [Salmonella enterica]
MTQIHSSGMTWGLRNDITPSFGARLIQQGNKLYFLADRASISGEFTSGQCRTLDKTFPRFIKQLELALKKGLLDKSENRQFSTTLNGWICEANTLGTFGYVFVTVYPSSIPASGIGEIP